MNVPIEQILFSLFAGSLCVTAFLIFGFLLFARAPSKSISKGLTECLCRTEEQGAVKLGKEHPRSEEADARVDGLELGDFSKWAIAVIAVGMVYSLGVVTEHLSDKWTDNARRFVFWVPVKAVPGDEVLRARAYHRIFNPYRRSGIPARQAAFFDEVDWLLDERNGCTDDSGDPRCKAIRDGINFSYYRAKSLVYKQGTYFEELNKIQRRIDYLRSLTFLMTVLILAAFTGLLLRKFGTRPLYAFRLSTGFAWALVLWFGVLGGWAIWWLVLVLLIGALLLVLAPVLVRKALTLGGGGLAHAMRHYRRLSFNKLALLLLGALLAWFGVIHAWEGEELSFDYRVFGYYLHALEDKAEPTESWTWKERIDYRTFGIGRLSRSGASARHKVAFEPSAIARVGDCDQALFLVANDKGGGSAELTFPLFEMDGEGNLVRSEGWSYSPARIAGKKFEAIARSRRDPHEFYAVTSFDRDEPAYRVLMRLSVSPGNRSVELEELLFPVDPDEAVRGTSGRCWSKVEAMTFDRSGDHLLVGVRAAGESFRSPEYGISILRYPDAESLLEAPSLLVDLESEQVTDLVDRAEGISSLEYSEELDRYLMLTSLEDDGYPAPRGQVGGHLWVLEGDLADFRDLRDWKNADRVSREVLSFKPEGVDINQCDKAVLVFDSDGDRKDRKGSQGRFKLWQSQDLFAVMPLP